MYTNITENMEWIFNHKNIHKYTWEQNTKILKTIIDYIITNHGLKLKIQKMKDGKNKKCTYKGNNGSEREAG